MKPKTDIGLDIVGIGASAGGLKAIQDLFSYLPEETNKAFIIIQHLSPDFKSLMPELLGKYTKMPIFTANDKQIIEPNCIYLNQRNKNLHIKGSKIYLLEKDHKHNLNMPIDIFFHTLGEEHKERATAIILSGTGSDGSRGIKSVKEFGGTVIVQDPKNAQFDGMPNSAINTNIVDFILNTDKIAQVLTNNSVRLFSESRTDDFANDIEVYLKNILIEVFKFSGIDFREYKINTLVRRIEKRMTINKINDIKAYTNFIAKDDNEKNALKNDFLIGVTHFFRDKEAFNILNKNVIPSICNGKLKNDTIRIWTPGCSSGEEVYSLAILFNEYIRKNKLGLEFKIFATDIDQRGLNKASIGIYDINALHDIDIAHLEDYFTKTENHYKIIKQIRDKVVFSSHNLINDPPFINMDLVTCRNLLIYLDTNMQKKVLQNFHFSLKMSGFLFLGNSESLGDISTHFKTINSKWKIFQNISKSKYAPHHSKPLTNLKIQENNYFNSTTLNRNYKKNTLEEVPFDKYLSRRHSPDAIFIDNNFNILFIKGQIGNKLHHREGLFENNLLKIVDKNISNLLKSGLRKLKNSNEDFIITEISTQTPSGNFNFDIKFHEPKTDPFLKDCYLIEFSEERISVKKDKTIISSTIIEDQSSSDVIEDLEYELKLLKKELQNTIEQLETTNEELQSSNEELMAANEELQSTNEELQSVNEELHTVNSELQNKNEELKEMSGDLINLLENTDIATIFLDTNLCIRKFTPAIKTIFNLEDRDVGRKLAVFKSNFNALTLKKLLKDAENSLKNLSVIEDQVNDKDGNYYIQRISPFITSNKVVNGVIITLNNINKIKSIEHKLNEADEKYYYLFQSLNEGFMHAKIIYNEKGEPADWEYIDVNPAYKAIMGLDDIKLKGRRISQVFPEFLNNSNEWIKKYGITASSGKNQTMSGYIDEINKYIRVNTFSPRIGEFACAIEDFTELKKNEDDLIKRNNELDEIQRLTQVGSWVYDVLSGEVKWSKELRRIFKLDPKQPVPDYPRQEKLYKPSSWAKLNNAFDLAIRTGKSYKLELEMIKTNGETGWLMAKGEAIKKDGKVTTLRGSVQDITTTKEYELALIHEKRRAEKSVKANQNKNLFLANMSHEIRTPISSVLGFADLLKGDNLTEEARLRFIEIIDHNSKQLLNLIDDIIDVSKIESEQLKITYKNCHVPKMIENLALTFEHIKQQRDKEHLRLKTVIPKDLKELEIRTDPRRLEQVLSNLINNAVKFSKKGTISFGFKKENTSLRFFVQDEGIGIPKHKQKEIFETFKQVHYKNNANYDGTGLGLAISKAIVNLLGGKINLKSKSYKGSRFEFTIPIIAASTEPSKSFEKSLKQVFQLNNKTILVAEDNKLIRMLLELFLKRTGAHLIFAANGKIAVEEFKQNPAIDLVLLDIRMPKMSGIEALEKILEIKPKTKVIMQTAHAMEDEKALCYDKGCVDFLSKPIIKEELYQTISKWLN